MTDLSRITDHKIIAILRGAGPEEVLRIARALHKGGIRVLEVTLNSPDAFDAIRLLAARIEKDFGGTLLLGAGTVMNAAEVKEALAAGARFIVSPTWDTATIQATKQGGAISIPGAFTPTEILGAYRDGGDIIKVFPGSSVGAKYFAELRAPMPYIPVMPTGGIHAGNIREYLDAGVVAFGVGSALLGSGFSGKAETITDAYLAEVTERATRFVEALWKNL